jgi:nitrous oxide reductase
MYDYAAYQYAEQQRYLAELEEQNQQQNQQPYYVQSQLEPASEAVGAAASAVENLSLNSAQSPVPQDQLVQSQDGVQLETNPEQVVVVPEEVQFVDEQGNPMYFDEATGQYCYYDPVLQQQQQLYYEQQLQYEQQAQAQQTFNAESDAVDLQAQQVHQHSQDPNHPGPLYPTLSSLAGTQQALP